MPGLDFQFEWEDADTSEGLELASTWASLAVRVNQSILTRVGRLCAPGEATVSTGIRASREP